MQIRTYWHNILDSRGAGMSLIERTIAIRYRHPVAGLFWSIGKPLLITVLFTVLFTAIIPLYSQHAPYVLIALIGSIAWNGFASGITNASMSLMNHDQIIKKINIPRIWFPLSSVAVDILECIAGLLIAECVCIAYGIPVSHRLFILPALISMLALYAAAIGILLAPLEARYRTVRHILPLVLQVGILLTPVGYVITMVPELFRTIFLYNPLTGIIEMMRWAFLGNNYDIAYEAFVRSLVILLVISACSFISIKNKEGTIADLL